MRFLFALLLSLAIAAGTPVERKPDGPLVVDVPAGMYDDSDDVAAPVPATQEKDAEVIQPEESADDETDTSNKKTPDTENFGFNSRIPTVFIIRRPAISDRFPFFQSESPFQSPFSQNFRPFSSLFETRRRPTFQVQKPDDDSVEDDSTHDMVSHMEQMMKRMQEQMSTLWGSFLSPSFHRPLRPIFPSFESAETDKGNDTTLINIDNLPANYSNSTSETKVVDGHVVQVNKTIHKISSGNNTSGFFHFEVINVRPTEGAKTESPIPESSDVKPVAPETPSKVASVVPESPKAEDPSLNEVGGSKKPVDDNTFPYLVNRRLYGSADEDESSEAEWIPRTEYTRPQFQPGPRSKSLNGDLRVNKVVQNQGIRSPYLLLNPDVELFDV